VVARVACWVPWIAVCLVQRARSSAQAVFAQTLRDDARTLQIALTWVGDVAVARVACWVAWIAVCLVQLAARASKP